MGEASRGHSQRTGASSLQSSEWVAVTRYNRACRSSPVTIAPICLIVFLCSCNFVATFTSHIVRLTVGIFTTPFLPKSADENSWVFVVPRNAGSKLVSTGPNGRDIRDICTSHRPIQTYFTGPEWVSSKQLFAWPFCQRPITC